MSIIYLVKNNILSKLRLRKVCHLHLCTYRTAHVQLGDIKSPVRQFLFMLLCMNKNSSMSG